MNIHMGYSKSELWYIPCDCFAYTNQLDHGWITEEKIEQPKYAFVTEFK